MSTPETPRDREGVAPSEHRHRNAESRYRTYQSESEGFDPQHERAEVISKETAQFIVGGSGFEVIAGAGAATLGILGLFGILPMIFVTIAIIAVGAGLMLAGGSIGAKYGDLLNTSDSHASMDSIAVTGGGITAETVGGAAGIALGILALIGVETLTLTPVAVIVLGGAMAFGATATRHLSRLVIAASGAPRYKQRVADESVKGAAVVQMVAGLGAALLGVLSLVGVGAGFTLSLVGVIVLGGGLLLSGLAVGGKVIRMLYKDEDDSEKSRYPVYGEYRHGSDAHPV